MGVTIGQSDVHKIVPLSFILKVWLKVQKVDDGSLLKTHHTHASTHLSRNETAQTIFKRYCWSLKKLFSTGGHHQAGMEQ